MSSGAASGGVGGTGPDAPGSDLPLDAPEPLDAGEDGNGGEDLQGAKVDSDEVDVPENLSPDVPSVPVDVAPVAPELARGRVGHWKLDEGRGNVGIDSSGIGNHGGTVNILGPDWHAGRIGTALLFTPSRRTFMIVASHPTLGPTEAISLSVWVNAASWSPSPRILQKGDDDIQYGLRAEGGELRFVLRLDGGLAAVGTPVPATNKWVHIAATYDGREMRLYLDGSPVAMQVAAGKVASPFTALTIGARSQTAPTSDFWSGLIDDIIIYERALSAAEVRLLSEAKSP